MNINLTLIGQAIAFTIFVGICLKYVWPPVITALRERQKRIADGLAAAERGEHEKELAEERAQEVIKSAKQEAAEILAQAQKQGNEVIEEAKASAGAERERIIQSGHAEIEQELNRARQALREQVAGIAMTGAARILEREVDDKAHQDLLDELSTQV